MNAAAVVNRLWHLASLPAARRFARALDDPGRWQRQRLARLLRANADTAFGRAHGFAAIRDPDHYRRAVPLRTYAGFAPWIERIRAGETTVLTRAAVTRLVPTGGSAGGSKLIPWTAGLAAEFTASIGAWIVDLQRRCPSLRDGPAYWSISPQGPQASGGAVPIGFEDDTAYLGRALAPVMASVLAAPSCLRGIDDLAAFRHATLRCLLAQRELRLISVWNPSFLTLLLDHAQSGRERLIADIRRGGATGLPAHLMRSARPWLGADPERAKELERADWSSPTALWPRLAMISCWADAAAGLPARALARRLGGVAIQAKGLLATEAAVTIPWRGRCVAAVTGPVLEFLSADGSPRWIDELTAGSVYEVVLTTAGGLARYRLGDLVRVEGFVGRTPCLRFLGRSGATCDLVGEKLDEAFVAACLDRVVPAAGFAMLAPNPSGDGYTLFSDRAVDAATLARLDGELAANPQYALARRLAQLAPLRAFQVAGTGAAVALAHRAVGRVLGAVKPLALDRDRGWDQRLPGAYLA